MLSKMKSRTRAERRHDGSLQSEIVGTVADRQSSATSSATEVSVEGLREASTLPQLDALAEQQSAHTPCGPRRGDKTN
jgi:hypothetical protein